MADPDYILDLGGLDPEEPHGAGPSGRPRRWLGVLFECCRIYHRVYRRAESSCYRGRCPRCCRELTVRVGPDGTTARFFTAR